LDVSVCSEGVLLQERIAGACKVPKVFLIVVHELKDRRSGEADDRKAE
jgi:hypothetical protein